LNIVFNYNFINANSEHSNSKSVDLKDRDNRTAATSYLTINRADPLKDDEMQYLSLNVQTPNFSFPIISTNIIATTYIQVSNENLHIYVGMRIPWNYASRNEEMKLVQTKNNTYGDETKQID